MCIFFADFLVGFAFDVFDEGRGFRGTAATLGIRFIPNDFLIIVLITSWRREWIEAIISCALGAGYIATFRAGSTGTPMH